MKRRIRAVLAATLLLTTSASAPRSKYHVDHSISIGGEGGWDCITLDPAAHRLFVSHATHVQVVDEKRGTILGDIPDTPGIHGVALAPGLGSGFTSNGRDSSVTVFDLKTLAVTDRIKLPARNPDAIVYDWISGRVFTMNGGSGTTTAIEAKTDSILGSLDLHGRPEFAVADGAGLMYANLEDSSAVIAFDTRTLAPLHRWPLAPGEEPTGLALDREHHRLFSGCANKKLIVLDSETGRLVADLPIGEGVDGVAFDATRRLIFSSNGDGTLTVIHEDDPDHFTVVGNVPTRRGGRTLALDESSGAVYIPTADFGPPPAPTAERPHPRPSVLPGSFRVLVVSP